MPAEIRVLFLGDARRHLQEAAPKAEAWGGEAAARAELRRHAHSLKGLAAAVGLEDMREVARALEGLAAASEGCLPPPAADGPLVVEALEELRRAVDAVELGIEPAAPGARDLSLRLDAARRAMTRA